MDKRPILLTGLLLSLGLAGAPAQAASLDQQQQRHQQRHQSVREQAQYDTQLQALKAQGNFTTLLDGLERAGLTGLLTGNGPHTLFAPTDDAFARMPDEQRRILEGDDVERLRKLLRYHLLPGLLPGDSLGMIEHPQALTGQLTIRHADDHYTVNGADIAPSQIVTRNGIIHPIDQVLVPYYEN
ncbi:putative surface protein with fasciclin (FAS1) repeats [Kushneria sinocarnis]|uniref:Putative surface protein with fasciclin (FAS1) repeats n=1 Tax=Kushneria sinocarnis TaxID=595502 RepID=A0A420WX60_9GAMM|nr:fasciclin domain-containing protein [Kushneria sinocarnis]RKR04316.1 putative surface protein with fasciclin (FAS1) repeats [Kushneria sinocarnis]